MTGLFKEAKKAEADVENGIEDALGHVINPIVHCVDVDGIVRRIDVNAVVGE